MGKSSRKSRKRLSSVSKGRLAGLESKLARLIDALEQSEIRTPRLSPSSPHLLKSLHYSEIPETQQVADTEYTDAFPEALSQEMSTPSAWVMAVPASQERSDIERN